MMNKKAQMAEGVLLLLTLVLSVYSGYAVYTFEKNTATKINAPEKLIQMYDYKSNFEIYGQQAFKMMTHASYAEFMPELQKENEKCSRLSDGTLILDDACLTSKVEDEKHLAEEELEAQYSLFFSKYNYSHKFSLNNQELKLEFDEIKLNVSDKEYNASYSFRESFTTSNPLIESISDIYSKMKAKKSECINLGSKDPSFDVMECSRGFKLEQWNSECQSKSTYLICNLKTKSNYFYNESFKPIELRLAIKILELAPVK